MKVNPIDPLDHELMGLAVEYGKAQRGTKVTFRAHIGPEINQLLQMCYAWGINPLSRLREVFPKFVWDHRDLEHWHQKSKSAYEAEVKKLISGADIFWQIYGTYRFVTMRLKNTSKPPRQKFGERFDSLYDHTHWPCEYLDWLESMGASPIESHHESEHEGCPILR